MAWILAGLILFVDVTMWFHHGGSLSLVSTIASVGRRAPAIDVADDALMLPMLLASSLMALAICRYADIDLTSRHAASVCALVVIGGGFVLDIAFGEAVIDRYLAANHYSRCASRDHETGTGKGREWFRNFVLDRAGCPA